MALVLKDRVKETSTTAGTGTLTLAGAVAGFQSFSAVGNGNTTYYAIVDAATGDWEVGIGTYTSSGTTLSRTTVLSSSNGGSLVTFTSNSKDVFVTYPASKGAYQDAAGVIAQTSFGAITATSAALTSGTVTTAPSAATDIVNKEYADSISSGLNYHQPVNYASTAALATYTYNNGASGVGATITAVANGALSMGGGSPTATQRVLVKDEIGANAPYNGVYTVTQAGTSLLPFILTRATDYDTSGSGTNEIDQGDYVLVISGTLASTAWVQQTPLPITVGTTALTFLQFNAPITYYAGTGLNLSPATTFNITNVGTSGTYGSASAVPVFVTNAQGQVTSVTNTNIAIAGSAVTGAIAGAAGSVANALTLGTYLTGTSFNGSAAVTATVDATSANTASKVVARDASGNFSAGTITATLSGAATSATTATNIAAGVANQIPYQSAVATTSFVTAPTVTGSVLSWNGSAFAYATNIATATSATSATSATTATNLAGGGAGQLPYNTGSGATSFLAAGTSGYLLQSNGTSAPSWVTAPVANNGTLTMAVSGTGLSGSQTFTANQATNATFTVTSNATNANTASTIVARDASGNFSAGTITATLSGNASTATSATSATSATTATTATTANATNTANNFQMNSLGVGTAASGTAGTTTGTRTLMVTGSAAAPAYSFSGWTNSGIYNPDGNSVGFSVNGTERGRFLTGFSVGTTADAGAGGIFATANITAYYSSDIKFKENVRNIPNAASTAAAIGGKLFDWNDAYIESKGGEDGYFIQKADFGIIAQDAQKHFPICVRTRPDGSLAVDYEKLSALALAANAEHEERIAKLEALVAKLIEG